MGSSGHNPLKQLLNNASTGRTQRKQASIAPKQPDKDTQFAIEDRTFLDVTTNSFVTEESSMHYILSCSCRVSSPNEIRGICNCCSRGLLAKLRRRPRYVCKRHTLCAKCLCLENNHPH